MQCTGEKRNRVRMQSECISWTMVFQKFLDTASLSFSLFHSIDVPSPPIQFRPSLFSSSRRRLSRRMRVWDFRVKLHGHVSREKKSVEPTVYLIRMERLGSKDNNRLVSYTRRHRIIGQPSPRSNVRVSDLILSLAWDVMGKPVKSSRE